MSIGLLALLDDVIALVKASAISLDDLSLQVGKVSTKVSGVVIDDAAVTPKYVIGLDPSRELSIIWHIAQKSIVNKVFILTPMILALGLYLPGLIKPMLMLGALYLCYEGYQKIQEIFLSHEHKEKQTLVEISSEELETIRTKSAVRTDFILSAEIVAIAYASVLEKSLLSQALILICVSLIITAAVYGFVALIVKLDDFGLYLAQSKTNFVRQSGIFTVKLMPGFLVALSYLGTIAMLWVGASIFIHNIISIEDFLHGLHLTWIFNILLQIAFALSLGAITALLLKMFLKIKCYFKS